MTNIGHYPHEAVYWTNSSHTVSETPSYVTDILVMVNGQIVLVFVAIKDMLTQYILIIAQVVQWRLGLF